MELPLALFAGALMPEVLDCPVAAPLLDPIPVPVEGVLLAPGVVVVLGLEPVPVVLCEPTLL